MGPPCKYEKVQFTTVPMSDLLSIISMFLILLTILSHLLSYEGFKDFI